MLKALIEVIGWIGALLILAAYGLISAGTLRARSPLYQLTNISVSYTHLVLKSKHLLDYNESAETLSYLDSIKGVRCV